MGYSLTCLKQAVKGTSKIACLRQVLVTGLLLQNYGEIFVNSLTLSPKKPWFLCVCNTSLLKTLREKEKNCS